MQIKVEEKDLLWSRWYERYLSLSFHIVATQKKRIGEQLNYFWGICPKPFWWAKNKRKLFSDAKSRGPLLGKVRFLLGGGGGGFGGEGHQ